MKSTSLFYFSVSIGVGFVLLITWAHWPVASLPEAASIDRLQLNKAERRLTLYNDGKPIRSYTVALSHNPTGEKQFEGDARVPEGTYRITFHHPESIAYKALRISYPNREDRLKAQEHGRSAGGLIEIHGLHPSMAWMGRAHYFFNYTLGCIAVTNDQMDVIYESVPDGTPIKIIPGKGTPGGWSVSPLVYDIAQEWLGLQVPGA